MFRNSPNLFAKLRVPTTTTMSDLLIRQTNNARMTSVSASDRSLIQERSQNHGKMWFCSLFTSFTRVFVRIPEGNQRCVGDLTVPKVTNATEKVANTKRSSQGAPNDSCRHRDSQNFPTISKRSKLEKRTISCFGTRQISSPNCEFRQQPP